MKKPDILAALEPLADALEKAKVSYFIGGSVASSAYGMPRATLDVDIVASISQKVVPILVQALSKDYYLDEEMILDAINRRSAFNLIHLETMLKIDVFVVGEEAYRRESLHRRRKEILRQTRPLRALRLCVRNSFVLPPDWVGIAFGPVHLHPETAQGKKIRCIL